MQNSKSDWAVIVPSCDGYRDLWPYFFNCLFKQFAGIPTPVYLVSNFASYEDERVKTIKVGKDLQWAANLKKALPEIPEKYLLILLDDFFLDKPVNEETFAQIRNDFKELNATYLCVDKMGKTAPTLPGTYFCPVTPDNFYVGLNATFWDKTFLESLCHAGDNIWKYEGRLKVFARQNSQSLFYLDPAAKVAFSYVESVKGYFWKPDARKFMDLMKWKPDYWRRPCPPQGQDPFSKLIRSFHKRRMKLRQKRDERRAEKYGGEVVSPLPGVTL